MSRSRPRRSKANRAQTRQPSRPKCPTPRKLAFTSEDHARSFLAHAAYEGRDYRPESPYRCGCGNWHLTSRPARE